MAVYRIRPRINFKHRAQIGVADLGAILLDKSTIIKLQLLNECSRAVLLLYAGDIISHLGQVNDLVDSRKVQDGYFVTGRMYSVYTVPNMVRNIYDLTVYIIEDKETQF
jgi:hypothetical protein